MRPTGVDVVDAVIGGLAPGLPLVLAGPSGSGRTVVSLQIAAAALAAEGIVVFVSAEPAPLLLRQAETLGLDLERAARSEQLILLELDPGAAASLAAAGGRACAQALLAEHPAVSLIAIDPFTALTAELLDEAPLRAAVRQLLAATPHASLLLTVETDRPHQHGPVERVLAEVCGSFLSLSRRPDGRRTLQVEKTRAGAGRAEAVELRIGPRGAELVGEIQRAREAPAGAASVEPAPAARESSPRSTAATLPLPGPEPVALPPPERRTPEPLPPAARRVREGPPLVLIVDEDEASRESLRRWLEPRYRVVTAADGFQAVTAMLAERPDLILLELVMTRVTGFELLAALHRVSQSIPILVLASQIVRTGDRLGPLVLGAVDVMEKPVQHFEIIHKVETLLRLEAAPPALLEPGEAQALFGSSSPSRQLPAAAFRERLSRACDFGRRFDAPSALVAIAAPTSEQLDRLVSACDACLRFEDALLLTSKRRVVLLLVAAEEEHVRLVIDRLGRHLRESGEEELLQRLRWRAYQAAPPDELGDWRALFEELEPWPPVPAS